MPAKSGGKSKLAGMLAKAGFKDRKTEETVFSGGGDLPAGIENAVAQLVECKFGEYQSGDLEGELFWHAAGVVVSPEFFTDADGNKIPIKGLRTSITEPLCDTPNSAGKKKTAGDHLSWILNELRKLGANTAEAGEDEIEQLCETLKEEGPHFRFRTWKPEPTKDYPNPRTFHQWQGTKGLENFVAGDTSDDVQDDTDSTTAAGDDGGDSGGDDTSTDTPDYPGDDEIKAIVKKAMNDKKPKEAEAAQNILQGHALVFGIDQDTIDNADSWEAVGDMIIEASAGDSTEGVDDDKKEDDETPWTPSKDDVVHYKPKVKNPKTKKMEPAKKPVECEVTKVDGKAKTVDLKNLTDSTIYKAVSFDEVTST